MIMSILTKTIAAIKENVASAETPPWQEVVEKSHCHFQVCTGKISGNFIARKVSRLSGESHKEFFARLNGMEKRLEKFLLKERKLKGVKINRIYL